MALGARKATTAQEVASKHSSVFPRPACSYSCNYPPYNDSLEKTLPVVSCRHLLLEIPHQGDPQLGPLVSSQGVRNNLRLHRGLDLRQGMSSSVPPFLVATYHLQRASDHSLEHLRVRQTSLYGLLG